MVMRAVPVDVLTRYLGGEATREVIRRCTQGPVTAKKGSNGSFVFPLVHPQVVRHAEGLGISPHIEANAFLYLEEREGTLDYVVAVGKERAIIGYGEFGTVSDRSRLVTAQRLSLWYTYETGGIHLTNLEDGISGVAQAPPTVVEIRAEELEQIVQKYAPKGVSDEEVARRVAESTRELRKESARLEQRNKDLEKRLTAANAVRTKSERGLAELQKQYDRADHELTDEKAARTALEGKLGEEKGRYASLDAAYQDFLARHSELPRLLDRLKERAKEIRGLKEALAAAQGGSGKPVASAYPPEITAEKDRFLYDLTKSLMRRCVERKRYTKDDTIGLGWNDAKLTYKPWTTDINFYTLLEREWGIIATSDPATNEHLLDAIRQVYYKASKNLSDLFPGMVKEKIPAYAVLFLQLTNFGAGPAKSPDKIQAQLGFTPEQISDGIEQGLFRVTSSGSIEKLGLNAVVRDAYVMFMKYRHELYQQCTATQTPS